MTLPAVEADAVRRFRARFGRGAVVVGAAPGRVNLIGEHVDYCGGLVLPMAIDRHVAIAAAPSEGAAIRVASGVFPGEAAFAPDGAAPPEMPAWARYVQGVVAEFARGVGPVPAFDAWVESDLPAGAGLSSSAALEVAAATLLERLTGRGLDAPARARLCRRAEQEHAGVPCGVMDQIACTCGRLGHALLIDCRNESWEPVPLWGGDLTLLVLDSGVRRSLAGGEYARRPAECEEARRRLGVASLRDLTEADLERCAQTLPPPLDRRARHVVSEIARTRSAVAALRARDWPALGALLEASHASLRDDFEVSCRELDLLVELLSSAGARDGGVLGARMTGGGFGGCVIALVAASAAREVAREVAGAYEKLAGRRVEVVFGATERRSDEGGE